MRCNFCVLSTLLLVLAWYFSASLYNFCIYTTCIPIYNYTHTLVMAWYISLHHCIISVYILHVYTYIQLYILTHW